MDIKVLKVAGDSNINAAADAALEEIKQNYGCKYRLYRHVKAGYQTVKVLILLTEKLVKMGYKFYMRPFYVKVDTLIHEYDTIPKTAIRWTLIAKKK
jgi:hypothetical protein